MRSGDPVADLVTFQIDESTANPAATAQEVQWVISPGNQHWRQITPWIALAKTYRLGSQTTLSFAPLADGVCGVGRRGLGFAFPKPPASLEVDAVPEAPISTIPETPRFGRST